MRKFGLLLALVVMVEVLVGCTFIDSRRDPETVTYLAAKGATYGLWRFKAVPLEDLERAAPYFQALHDGLEAETEEALDEMVGQFLSGRIDELADERDGPLLKEMLAAALDDVRFKAPDVLTDERREVALWIVGGILDGIAYAREAAKEPDL